MSRIIKRKYRQVRKEFRHDLFMVASQNPAFAMMIISTYTASRHREHIMKIWELLGFNHREAYKDYCNKLAGEMLTGRDEIMRALYFSEPELHEKYARMVPESFAMGDALAVAYRVLKG